VSAQAARRDAGDKSDGLFNRDFVLLWQGQLVSNVGSQAFVIALVYWTMEATGSATMMAVLVIGATLPAILMGPFAGAIADRESRKRIIVLGDVARGAMMLGVAWVATTHRGETDLIIGTLFTASVVGGVIGAVFNPAVGAAIPDLVPASTLTRANSIMQLSGQAAAVLGQTAGGVLYRVLGAPLLFLIDGASFLVSAASESWIRLPARERGTTKSRPFVRMYLIDARAGMTFVWRHAALRALVLTATILNFVFTPLFVLLPFFVRDALHADAASYGFLLGALSAGSIAGMAVAGSVPPEGSRRERILTGSFLLLPVLLLALAVSKDVVLALLILFAAGLLSGLINVVVITLVQIESAPEMRGRVLSIVFALAQAAMPVGMVIGGVVADVSGTGVAAILAGFGTVGLLAVARGIRSAPLRALLAGGRTSAAS
jgi:MFS family permease